MKKINSILTSLLLTATVFLTQQATAQAPQKMSYQSVIRNSSNVLLAGTQVGIRISVLQGSETGPAVYVETQTATTNGNGLLSIKIGTGTAITGTFAGINWANASYFIKTETDPAGGSNYTITGTQEILSVPYAMYAAKSGDSTTMGAIGGSSTANGGTITSGVLSLTPADAANGGIVTIGAQTFAGNKTLTGTLGVGTATPAASAQLDVSSTTKGLLPPRMTTTQRDLIGTPATGLVIFNTTTNSLETKNSSGWVSLSSSFVPLPAIVIGKQQWMKENLDVVTYRNGDIIPRVTDPTAWAALTTGAWCYYNNDPEDGAIYGKLYNWYAVNDARGLAPQGWHIPTDAEWDTLSTKLGGVTLAGGKMKTTGTTWNAPNTGATNESGFAGLPGGYRLYDGTFSLVGFYGFWWSATETITTDAWFRYLTYNLGSLYRDKYDKTYGFSVRCLRD
jgi:uncharacterized protein (TIGR02145 family)